MDVSRSDSTFSQDTSHLALQPDTSASTERTYKIPQSLALGSRKEESSSQGRKLAATYSSRGRLNLAKPVSKPASTIDIVAPESPFLAPTRKGPESSVSSRIEASSVPILSREDSTDETDEETLQLELQAIQIQLKLKQKRLRRLQSRKGSSPPPTKLIQVTPTKRAEIPSPSRVALGIDKGLCGRHISLRRPPESSQPGKSFNERISEARQQEKRDSEKRERLTRLKRQKTTGFEYQLEKDSMPDSMPNSTLPVYHSNLFESFSKLHLSRRNLPQSRLEQHLAGKKAFLIPQLLKVIKAPFDLPESLESTDFVVFGTVASKSPPLSHKRNQPGSVSFGSAYEEATHSEANLNGKYMVITLSDLKWTLDLYLFTSAFTRFYKLALGTVVAILNPGIMPPPPGKIDTNRWSLVLSANEDTVLEIGTSRDLGFCQTVKKDGKTCSTWINASKTSYCEWHIDQSLERSRRGRMDVQGAVAPRAAKDRTYLVPRSLLGSLPGSITDRKDPEALRQRLATREKEKKLAAQMGLLGSGVGAEYLSAPKPESHVLPSKQPQQRLENHASHVLLSPLKRKHLERQRKPLAIDEDELDII